MSTTLSLRQSDYVRLDDVCDIVQGGRHKLTGKQFVNSGGFPAYGAGGLNGHLDSYEFEKPGIILSAIGARCGKCFLPTGKWSSLANTSVFFPDESKADTRFLWYQLNDESSWHRSGTAQPFIKPSDIKRRKVLLPPLAEQKRIAGILDAADAMRARRREALAQLDTLLQTTFLELFGDPVTNPKRWESSTLDHIASKVTDGEHLNPPFSNDGMPMVMAGNVVEAGVDLSNVKYVLPALGEKFRKKCGPEQGDLLLVSRGATIGRMCMVASMPPFCLMGSVILIKVNQGLTTPAYLAGFLRCPAIRADLYKTSGSSAQQAIYIKDIRRLKCMLPPLKVQRQYDVIAQSVARQVPQHVAHLAELDTLFASLQSRAFRGEL